MKKAVAQAARDSELKLREIALNGKLRTNDDPSSIGASDFSILKNLRYKDNNPYGVGGMTKVNTSALANPKFKNGIHYRKTYPATESNVLVQSYDASDANPKVYKNSTAIPSQGNFTATALFTDTSGGSTGRFSLAPNDKVIYTNGKDTAIWGGSEMQCSAYADYDPDGTYKYDYSNQMDNPLTDSNNLATVHRHTDSIDANTMCLLHCDGTDEGTTFTDSSGLSHNATAVGNANTETSDYKFGTASCELDGTGDYLTVADHADFDFSATGSNGNWTVDLWVKGKAGSTTGVPGGTWFSQATAAGTGDYMRIGFTGLSIYAASSEVVALAWPSNTFLVPGGSSAQWRHIAAVGKKTGSTYDYYLFCDGTLRASLIGDAQCPANYNRAICIGAWDNGTTVADVITACKIDEVRISDSARWTTDFEPRTNAYGQGNVFSVYIGSQLPLQGINWYVQTANITAGSATAYYWGSGASWVSVGTVTGVGSTPFSTTGKHTWTFTSTESVAKQKIIDGVKLYWYKVDVLEPDTTTQFYQVTLDAPFQSIKELWDGDYRSEASFQIYSSSTFHDNTVNVLEDSYDTSNTATFAELDSIAAATDFFVVGFPERQSGLKIGLIGAHVNTTASTSATVYYCNGASPATNTSSWATVGALDDGTVANGISFAKSGLITWSPPELASEFKTTVANFSRGSDSDSPLLYFYKVQFSQNLSADVQAYYIAGVPAAEDVPGYTFSLSHVNRIFLFGSEAEPNGWRCSAVNAPQVLNGEDTKNDYLGDNTKPVAAASVYSRFGSTTENVAVICKQNETWVLLGSSPETFKQYPFDRTIGCVAPLTMTAVPSYELNQISAKPVAIWQSTRGIELFDGSQITSISADIKDKFDPLHANYVGVSTLATCAGFYDPIYNEYHWIVPGSQEWVYDLGRKKWFQIVRGTGKYLQIGFPVVDSNGQSYAFGALSTGYIERLENGTDFDGTAIAHELRIGDVALIDGSLGYRTSLHGIRLYAKSKNTTTNDIVIVHYGDGKTSGTTLDSISPDNSSGRLIKKYISCPILKHVLHSIDLSISTSNETIGLEPLYLILYYKVSEMDLL